MGLIKRPSELEVKQTLTALIYGQPGAGKSTLACSAPSPVMLDFDGGATRINGAHQVPTVQVKRWEDVEAALNEIKAAGEFSTIIIDTVGKMMMYMEEFIKRTNAKMKNYDGSLTLKGYGLRKQMFLNFIKSVSVMGMNIVFVGHEIEQKRGDDTIIRPEIGGSSTNDLMKELDLVGYVETIGQSRTISFDPCDKYYAKNTCNMGGIIKLPILTDNDGNAVGENNFLCKAIDAYKARQAHNIELTGKYEALCEEIHEKVNAIESANDANEFVVWIKSQEQVMNSKAVALAALSAKTSSLGLVFNKKNGVYE